MNKKLLVSFDVSSISITSEQMALSFLHAFNVLPVSPPPLRWWDVKVLL